jgi:hypothetical protein
MVFSPNWIKYGSTQWIPSSEPLWKNVHINHLSMFMYLFSCFSWIPAFSEGSPPFWVSQLGRGRALARLQRTASRTADASTWKWLSAGPAPSGTGAVWLHFLGGDRQLGAPSCSMDHCTVPAFHDKWVSAVQWHSTEGNASLSIARQDKAHSLHWPLAQIRLCQAVARPCHAGLAVQPCVWIVCIGQNFVYCFYCMYGMCGIYWFM